MAEIHRPGRLDSIRQTIQSVHLPRRSTPETPQVIEENPLVLMNQAAKRNEASIDRAKLIFAGEHVLNTTAMGSMSVIYAASEIYPPAVYIPLLVGAFGLGVCNFSRFLNFRVNRAGTTLMHQQETILEMLKEDGIPEDSLPKSEYDAPGISEREVKYHMARKARNTKLLLAQRGRLNDYQPFKWIESAAIPEFLKPTQEELDEVDQWAEDYRSRTNEFVTELSKKRMIIVECGEEFLKETTRVFLFKDPNDVWKYDTMPLMDVMNHWGATAQERSMVGLKNSWIYRGAHPEKPYEGIYSKIGRQRVVDFFGKPMAFYTGGGIVMEKVDKYGIGITDPDFFMDEGVVEYFYTRNAPGGLFFNPHACLETVEPSATRAGKVGLVTTKSKIDPKGLVVARA